MKDPTVGDVLNDFFLLMQGIVAPSENVGKDTLAGLELSTVFVHDLKMFETAIGDQKSWYPVERYNTKDKARAGHETWLERLPTLTSVTQLGYGNTLNEQTVILEKNPDFS